MILRNSIKLSLVLTIALALTMSVFADTYEVTPEGTSTDIRHFDGKVGIGTSTPSAKLTVDGGAILVSGETGGTPVSGVGARLMWIPARSAFRAGKVYDTQWDDANIGSFSVAFGGDTIASGYLSTCFGLLGEASGALSTCFGGFGEASGQSSIHFGQNGIASGMYSTHFGQSGIAAGDNSWVGGKNMQLSAAADGSFAWGYSDTPVSITQPDAFIIYSSDVGIGTTSPTEKLHVVGNGYFTGTVTTGSSRDLKTNIESLNTEEALDAFMALNPVKFNYKADKNELNLGFIAEDVPELVATNDRKSLSSMDLVTVSIKVIQQQQESVEEQKQSIEILQNRIEALEKALTN